MIKAVRDGRCVSSLLDLRFGLAKEGDNEDPNDTPPPYPPDEEPPAPVKDPRRPRPDVEDPKRRRPQTTMAATHDRKR